MFRVWTACLIVALLLPSFVFAEEKLSLKDCFELARGYSDRVAISAHEIERARARYMQSLGELLPQISFKLSELLQDPSAADGGDESVRRTLTQLSRTEGAFNFQQVLFRGLQEYQAVGIAKLDKRRADLVRKDVERRLFGDVAVAFFTTALTEQDIETDQMIIEVIGGRIDELRRRVRLGRSREGELTQEQALLALLEADLVRKQGQRAVAYEILSFLTGKDPMPTIKWSDPNMNANQSVTFYLEKIENRPDVASIRTVKQIADKNIKVARGNFLPRLDAEANLYTFRPGFLSDVKWDAQFQLDVPLFRFQNFGIYKEAKVEAKQAELELEDLQRVARREVKVAYEDYQSAQAQHERYRKAAELAFKNFKLQSRDFELGRATHLDVLTAQRTWLDSLDQRNRAEVQTWLEWTRLQLAGGVLP